MRETHPTNASRRHTTPSLAGSLGSIPGRDNCPGKGLRVLILSEAGGPLRLVVPWASGARCERDTGEEVLPAGEAEIATDVGERIRLTSAV